MKFYLALVVVCLASASTTLSESNKEASATSPAPITTSTKAAADLTGSSTVLVGSSLAPESPKNKKSNETLQAGESKPEAFLVQLKPKKHAVRSETSRTATTGSGQNKYLLLLRLPEDHAPAASNGQQQYEQQQNGGDIGFDSQPQQQSQSSHQQSNEQESDYEGNQGGSGGFADAIQEKDMGDDAPISPPAQPDEDQQGFDDSQFGRNFEQIGQQFEFERTRQSQNFAQSDSYETDQQQEQQGAQQPIDSGNSGQQQQQDYGDYPQQQQPIEQPQQQQTQPDYPIEQPQQQQQELPVQQDQDYSSPVQSQQTDFGEPEPAAPIPSPSPASVKGGARKSGPIKGKQPLNQPPASYVAPGKGTKTVNYRTQIDHQVPSKTFQQAPNQQLQPQQPQQQQEDDFGSNFQQQSFQPQQQQQQQDSFDDQQIEAKDQGEKKVPVLLIQLPQQQQQQQPEPQHPIIDEPLPLAPAPVKGRKSGSKRSSSTKGGRKSSKGSASPAVKGRNKVSGTKRPKIPQPPIVQQQQQAPISQAPISQAPISQAPIAQAPIATKGGPSFAAIPQQQSAIKGGPIKGGPVKGRAPSAIKSLPPPPSGKRPKAHISSVKNVSGVKTGRPSTFQTFVMGSQAIKAFNQQVKGRPADIQPVQQQQQQQQEFDAPIVSQEQEPIFHQEQLPEPVQQQEQPHQQQEQFFEPVQQQQQSFAPQQQPEFIPQQQQEPIPQQQQEIIPQQQQEFIPQQQQQDFAPQPQQQQQNEQDFDQPEPIQVPQQPQQQKSYFPQENEFGGVKGHAAPKPIAPIKGSQPQLQYDFRPTPVQAPLAPSFPTKGGSPQPQPQAIKGRDPLPLPAPAAVKGGPINQPQQQQHHNTRFAQPTPEQLSYLRREPVKLRPFPPSPANVAKQHQQPATSHLQKPEPLVPIVGRPNRIQQSQPIYQQQQQPVYQQQQKQQPIFQQQPSSFNNGPSFSGYGPSETVQFRPQQNFNQAPIQQHQSNYNSGPIQQQSQKSYNSAPIQQQLPSYQSQPQQQFNGYGSNSGPAKQQPFRPISAPIQRPSGPRQQPQQFGGNNNGYNSYNVQSSSNQNSGYGNKHPSFQSNFNYMPQASEKSFNRKLVLLLFNRNELEKNANLIRPEQIARDLAANGFPKKAYRA